MCRPLLIEAVDEMVQVEDEVDAVEDAGAVLLPAWTSIEIILVTFIALLFLLIYYLP